MTADASEKESAKAGLYLNIMKTKSVTTEEMCNHEDAEIVNHFSYLGSVINSNGDCSQGIKRDMEGQQWDNWERSSRGKMWD